MKKVLSLFLVVIMCFGLICTVNAADVEPLTFTAQEDNSSIALIRRGRIYNNSCVINVNGTGWQKYTFGKVINLNKGDTLAMKGTGIQSKDTKNYFQFSMTGKIAAAGNIMSLSDKIKRFGFYNLFSGCSALVTAPELPATEMKESCYEGMFQNCINLEEAPELPATELAKHCYRNMFFRCEKVKMIVVRDKNVYFHSVDDMIKFTDGIIINK